MTWQRDGVGWDGEKLHGSPCLHIAVAPKTLMSRPFSLCLSVAETAVGSQNSSQYRGEILFLIYHVKPLAFTLVAPCTAVGSTTRERGRHHNEQVAPCSAGAIKLGERRATRQKGTNIEEVQMEEKRRKFTHNLERKNLGKDAGTDNYTKTW